MEQDIGGFSRQVLYRGEILRTAESELLRAAGSGKGVTTS